MWRDDTPDRTNGSSAGQGPDAASARPPGRNGPRTLLRVVLLVAARCVAMAACIVAIILVVNEVQRRTMPMATTFDQVFDRLGLALALGVLGGTALGALLTHRLGRKTFEWPARLLLSLVAAALLLVTVLTYGVH